jgi:transposase
VLVDKLGLLLHALVTAADVQDRDGGVLLLSTLFGQFPFLRKLFADGAYAGPVFFDGITNILPNLSVATVKRPDNIKGFVVEPQRWIVERTIGWLQAFRRLVTRYEYYAFLFHSFAKLACLMIVLRRF